MRRVLAVVSFIAVLAAGQPLEAQVSPAFDLSGSKLVITTSPVRSDPSLCVNKISMSGFEPGAYYLIRQNLDNVDGSLRLLGTLFILQMSSRGSDTATFTAPAGRIDARVYRWDGDGELVYAYNWIDTDRESLSGDRRSWRCG